LTRDAALRRLIIITVVALAAIVPVASGAGFLSRRTAWLVALRDDYRTAFYVEVHGSPDWVVIGIRVSCKRMSATRFDCWDYKLERLYDHGQSNIRCRYKISVIGTDRHVRIRYYDRSNHCGVVS
jgi:hypothetical protein